MVWDWALSGRWRDKVISGQQHRVSRDPGVRMNRQACRIMNNLAQTKIVRGKVRERGVDKDLCKAKCFHLPS